MHKVLVKKFFGKRPLGRTSGRCNNIINIEGREIGSKNDRCLELA
jgi:hypothetical protein